MNLDGNIKEYVCCSLNFRFVAILYRFIHKGEQMLTKFSDQASHGKTYCNLSDDHYGFVKIFIKTIKHK